MKSLRKTSEFTRFVIVDTGGNAFDVTPENFAQCPIFLKSESVYNLLRQFVSNELAQGVGSETPPKHIDYMRQHELVDYCEVSEKGHYNMVSQRRNGSKTHSGLCVSAGPRVGRC